MGEGEELERMNAPSTVSVAGLLALYALCPACLYGAPRERHCEGEG